MFSQRSLLSVDGIADFNALHSRKQDEEVQLYAFIASRSMVRICASCPSPRTKTWRSWRRSTNRRGHDLEGAKQPWKTLELRRPLKAETGV
jgi:hypothetical protein